MSLRSKKAEDLSIRQINSLLSFRKSREALITLNRFEGATCPTCKSHPGNTYCNFCSNCGQKLSWNNYYKEVGRWDYVWEGYWPEDVKQRLKVNWDED